MLDSILHQKPNDSLPSLHPPSQYFDYGAYLGIPRSKESVARTADKTPEGYNRVSQIYLVKSEKMDVNTGRRPQTDLNKSNSVMHLSKLGLLSKSLENELVNTQNSRSGSEDRRKSSCMVHNLLAMTDPKMGEARHYPATASAPDLGIEHEDDTQSLSPRGNFELMSKDAISDVAVSVRDLSSNLSNVTIKLQIRNILIVSKIYDTSLIPTTRELALWLLNLNSKHGHLNVFVQDVLKNDAHFGYKQLTDRGDNAKLDRLYFWTEEMCANHPNLFDFVITLGGDGTVLFTSWLFQNVVPPVLSFSMGSLGFMTEYDYVDKDQIISGILEEGVSCSLRMRFECTIMKANSSEGKDENDLAKEVAQAGKIGSFVQSHTVADTYCILNDVVVDRGPNPTITTTELFGDSQLLTAIEADGVVISTPSGSTAYSLSAGGSLVHPDLPAILVSPICAHTLSFRPLVLPDSLIIRVGVPYDARESAWCAFDGKSRVELDRGDLLTISASRFPFPKVTNGSLPTSWFQRLSQTLHWNERKRQKPISF